MRDIINADILSWGYFEWDIMIAYLLNVPKNVTIIFDEDMILQVVVLRIVVS